MRFFNFLFCIILLSGCAVGPDFTPPQAPQTNSYTENPLPQKTAEAYIHGGQAQSFIWGKDISACWWKLFHSKSLNQLIEKGIRNNPTLESAQASIRQAEQNLIVTTGALFPYVFGQFSEARQQFSASEFGIPTPPTRFNLYNISLNVSYTFDFWGGIRRQVESSQALLDQQRFLFEASYLTLTSNIVTSAITEASLREQVKATEELIALQKEQLAITQKKYALGGVSLLDVTAQQTLLAQTEATLPPLQQNLGKIRNALAVLIGEPPSKEKVPAFCLTELTLPKDLPLSLPSLFVRQRPDIRAAEEALHAASAQIGVSTANLFPQLTLTANLGGSANFIRDLFTSGAETWLALGNILQPLFKGGALIAQRKSDIAGFEKALGVYRQTVLEGLQNVADTLYALQNDAKQLQIQTQAENVARETLYLTQAQYQAGSINYINFLDAQKQYLQARIGRIQAQAARFADTVALFQAMGGGWWNRCAPCPPPTVAPGGSAAPKIQKEDKK